MDYQEELKKEISELSRKIYSLLSEGSASSIAESIQLIVRLEALQKHMGHEE